MLHRRFSPCLFAGLLAAILPAVSPAQSKRPLSHKDYGGWRTITSQHLSNDGKFLAYGVFPQEGDGEVIVRNLDTGQETSHPAGARPPPPAPTGEEEGPPPRARAVTIAFSADSKTLVFSTFPSKADVDKAKKEKKKPEQMPKDAMVIVNLASDAVTKIERVKQFHLPEKASGYLAYLKEASGGRRAGTRGGRHEGTR